jgi:MoxR-like ATPase
MPTLRGTEGTAAGRTIDIPDSGLLIGRRSDVGLILEDGLVSGHHARISHNEGKWAIDDLDSANGTVLNDKDIQSSRLESGDIIRIGAEHFVFSVDGETVVAETPPEAPAAPKKKMITRTTEPQTTASAEDVALVEKMQQQTDAIRAEVGKVIIGQVDVVDQILMCMIAGGHGLLIGLPGMAKTLMVSTIAKVLDLQFKRVQFTPDLMPGDITGTEILETNRETGDKEFRFVKGPLFCNLLLADEINRTPPKTQAALLEAMQEKRVTAGNETFTLDAPFFVLATQNPIEQEGTYPLPEAQQDRFMFNIWVDYPEENEEEQIVESTTSGELKEPDCVLSREEVLQLQDVVRKVPVSEHVIKYAIKLVRATRPSIETAPEITKNYVSTGAGPRAGQFLVLAAKARAVLEGRIHVASSDIRSAAVPVLRHRILTNFSADSEGLSPMNIVEKLLEEIPEPGPEDYKDA